MPEWYAEDLAEIGATEELEITVARALAKTGKNKAAIAVTRVCPVTRVILCRGTPG